MGIAVTTVTTTAQAPLGFIHTEPASLSQGLAAQGEKTWIYVKASGSALAAGSVCARQAGSGNYGDLVVGPTPNGVVTCVAADSSTQIVGVAQHAIPDGEFGFIQRTGIGTVLVATGGCTADTALRPDANADGRDVGFIVDVSFAWALATVAAGAGATVRAVMNCEG
jgi:hypothetical protein